MRVSPIGLAAGSWQRAAVWAGQDAMLTHPHPVCVAASAAYAAAIAAGLEGTRPKEMWALACEIAGRGTEAGTWEDGGAVREILLRARESGPKDATRHQGWVLIAPQNAFHRLLAGQPLEAALVGTVMMGGDTDTNAAICRALLGAAQGRDAVPLHWRRQVLGRRPVPIPETRHPRPASFWTDDAMDLAEALVVAAR